MFGDLILQAVDVIICLLKTPISELRSDVSNLHEVFRQFYQVLHTYTKGGSKKNAVYAANYLPFFMEQLSFLGSVGHECCKMMIDLVRDNRSIVDRIMPDDIKAIVSLFNTEQHYLYLDLLGVLSVCNGIAMTENQTLIVQELLEKQKENLCLIELGQDLGLNKNILYVSMDGGNSWTKLHTMSYRSNADYDEQEYLFLTHQLDLYKCLCYGRNQKAINVITRTREFFSWEVGYRGLMTEILPFNMRAKFCDLLIGLFLDVGDNHSIIAITTNNFVYDEIDVKNYGQASTDSAVQDIDSQFPSLRVWLNQFFADNSLLVSSQPGRNILLKEVLRLATSLVKYGYLGSREELGEFIKPVFNLLDGTTDVPFEPGKGTEFTRTQMSVVREWRKNGRFEKSPEIDAIMEVKIQGLEMMEILLIKEFNRRVRYFVSVFKKIDMAEDRRKGNSKQLGKLLYDDFDTRKLWKSSGIRKKIDKFLKSMYSMTALLEPNLPAILFDLTKYPSDVLNTKSLHILNKFYSSRLNLFCTAQRSLALLTTESVRVHRGAVQNMMILTRLIKSKLSSDMADEVVRILNSFAELCYAPYEPLIPHTIGQNILMNNGLLDLLIPLVTQEIDTNLKDRFQISQRVIGAGLNVMRFLAQKNSFVQTYLMNHLQALLSVQCCGELQALALLELFQEHTVHCLRLQSQNMQKIVRLAGKYQEHAPSVLLLLKAIMKMEKSQTLIKRNQYLVTKYIMENYKSAAYVMSYSQSRRLHVLIGKEGEDHQRYLINLVELLATCAEGENRYMESLCQTLMTVPELLKILNNRNVPMNFKVGFARYFVWAYMRTARTAVESGVDDLHHDEHMWKHLQILQTLMSRINVLSAKIKAEMEDSDSGSAWDSRKGEYRHSQVSFSSSLASKRPSVDYRRPSLGSHRNSVDHLSPYLALPRRSVDYRRPSSTSPRHSMDYRRPSSTSHRRSVSYRRSSSTSPRRSMDYLRPPLASPRRSVDYRRSSSVSPRRSVDYRRSSSASPTHSADSRRPSSISQRCSMNSRRPSAVLQGPSVLLALMQMNRPMATTPLIAVSELDSDVDYEGIATYMIEVGFLLIQTFFSNFYKEDEETHPEEIQILRTLSSATMRFTDFCSEFATVNSELCSMVECIQTLAQALKVTKEDMDRVCKETHFRETVEKMRAKVEEVSPNYNREEVRINKKMQNFAMRLGTYLEGQNSLKAQLDIRGRRANQSYIPEDLEVKIPLGQEFQVHVKSFALNGPEGSQPIQSIIKHLGIAALNVKNHSFVPDEELDIRSIQILRTLIYNKYITLPDNWAENVNTHKNTLAEIRTIQDTFIDNNIVETIFPLLARPLTVAMELLSLIDLLLFNSNNKAQKRIFTYFAQTCKDETFFMFVRHRLVEARRALKERRSMRSQAEGKRQERSKRKESLQTVNKPEEEKEVKMNKRALKKKSMRPFFQRMSANRLLSFDEGSDIENTKKLDLGLMGPSNDEYEEDEQEEDMVAGNYQDGSDVVLVLRIVARLCDGQYTPLQNYLRDQPDNILKFNLVSEITVFFGGMYTHFNGDTVALTTQVISTLQEICVGNQENRAVLFNNKIMDYINFLLCVPHFEGCEIEQVVELKMELLNLLYTLIEENGPGATLIAKETCDTVDLASIRRHIYMAYSIVHLETGDAETLIVGASLKDGKTKKKKKLSKEMKEQINALGFSFYFTMARLFDIDIKLQKKGFDNAQEKAAFLHYKGKCQSVEVVKDGHLQRVHFRIKNPDVLREEVIEEVKWNIDRTSPSNKLRDFLFWAKDILDDMEYQNKILGNPIIKQMAKRWAIWNYASILLSFAITVLMLVTWDSAGNINDFPDNITALPHALLDRKPEIHFQHYLLLVDILGACHNVCCVMLFSCYILLKHPRMPDFSFFTKCAKHFKKQPETEADEVETVTELPATKTEPVVEEEIGASRLRPSLISVTTIYYLMMMVLSFTGTFWENHFFAFHLLNILATNRLLKGVVKAVTQNGKSLLWVAIMGMVIIYLYALLAFAFLRASFKEEEDLYCQTLAQCFVTTLRYGIIGDITDVVQLHDLSKNFVNFVFLTIYQLSFFILFTTIGLNIIFGIIVDTFSELRDLKGAAEKDMQGVCFICGRDSYDFEHNSKGFAHHVAWEHNMWAYVFYLLHLKETNDADCGAIDYYVLKLVRSGSMDFFPMNRALCLSQDDSDEADTKLDDVVTTLGFLQKRHQMEDQLKRREAERRRQVVWHDQFRRTSLLQDQSNKADSHSSMETSDTNNMADESHA